MDERSVDSDESRLPPVRCTSEAIISVADLSRLIPVLSFFGILPLLSISVVFFSSTFCFLPVFFASDVCS